MNWHFRSKRPDDTTRESIGGEFFSNDSLKDGFPQALVREGVQNSLDARCGDQPTRVRIFLSEASAAVPAAEVSPFAASLFPHLSAKPNDKMDPPLENEACPYLVFEDFGTTGLEGNIRQWSHLDGDNPFFAFLRAEGISDKSAQDSGRWGIGKFVFPRSSRARAFFSLTVRNSDPNRNQLLMGRAILRGHCVEGSERVPDGYFGSPESIQGCEFIMPVADQDLTKRFHSTFRLERQAAPGLSVVVPWYLDTEITVAKLAAAAIREYFLPISEGRLTIDVCSPSQTFHLDREGLDAAILALGEDFETEMGLLVELARFASSSPPDRILLNPMTGSGGPRWGDDLIPDLLKERIRTGLSSGRPVAIRVPVTIRPKKRVPESSYFDVYLVQDSASEHAFATFVRGNITIPGQRLVKISDHRALVHIGDRPMATLLGDAENPSHTQWNKDGDNFRTKYDYGDAYLTFVRQSAKRIHEIVYGTASAADPELLSDVFFKPGTERPGARGSRPGRKRVKPVPPGPPGPIQPRPQYFLIRDTSSGFSVGPGGAAVPSSATVEVRVAYDVHSGDPFKNFNRADFSFMKDEIKVVGSNIEVAVLADNVLRLKIVQPAFKLNATGFDPFRDLVVRAKLVELPDDDTTT